MPASYTAERKAFNQSSSASSFSIVPASNCTTGSTLILVFTGFANVVTSVTDTQSNTWHVDKTAATASGSAAVCSAYQAVGLTTGDTISVTLGGSSPGYNYWLEEFAGNYSVLDVSASATISNSSTLFTGTTATTTSADEMAIAAVAVSAGTITKNASYTLFTTGQNISASSTWYRILTATGTQLGDGTGSTMTNGVGLIATYKAGAAPPPVGIPDVGMALTVT